MAEGLDLRDRVALMILSQLISAKLRGNRTLFPGSKLPFNEQAAATSYGMADAMMAARERKPEVPTDG